MRKSIWKSLLTFVLVLALTVGTVAALSMATAAKAETAPARYSQQVRETQMPPAKELSAALPEEASSPVSGMAAFALVLVISGLGFSLFLVSLRKGRSAAAHSGRRYSPRADMTFSDPVSTKRV